MATPRTHSGFRIGDRFTDALPFAVLGALYVISLVVLFGPPHAARSSTPSAWQYLFNLGAFILFVSFITAILPVVRQEVDTDSTFVCGLVSTAALVPTTIAEISTVAAYVAPITGKHTALLLGVHQLALLIGAFTGLTAWGIWAIYYRRLGTVHRQNASVYARLCEQCYELRTTYEVERARLGASPAPETRTRLDRIEQNLDEIERELGLSPGAEIRVGLKWILSTGYTNLWLHLHALDEALLELAADDALYERALGDVSILQRSAVPKAPQLLRVLRSALSTLRPEGASVVDYLITDNEIGSTKLLGIHEAPAGTATTISDEARASARVALRRVRHAILEFRDSTWTQLVRRRNHLLETVIYTRITGYALMGLAILLGVPSQALLAAAVYYFVGALIALFNRLRVADKAEEVEDYGFTSATLVQTTPFSGLAAVGGVLVTSLLVTATNHTQQGTTDLGAIFDLHGNQFGLLTAAIFGLTPRLLTSRIEGASEQHKVDLKSTHGS